MGLRALIENWSPFYSHFCKGIQVQYKMCFILIQILTDVSLWNLAYDTKIVLLRRMQSVVDSQESNLEQHIFHQIRIVTKVPLWNGTLVGITWKHFLRYWPFERGIHRSPVEPLHKGQWRGALMFSLNKRLSSQSKRRHRAHYDVTIMRQSFIWWQSARQCLCWPFTF